MYAGAAHADTGEYRECVRLWNYALSLKIMKVVIRGIRDNDMTRCFRRPC